MTDLPPDHRPANEMVAADTSFPAAEIRQRRFLAVWLIPLIAALVAGYLGIRSYNEHGPVVTLSFRTAEGLSAGQTQIKYKSVTLGTIEDIALSPDLSGVVAHARMTSAATPLLTDQAHFWIVRPVLNTSNISDIQSLVSGTYIQFEPGSNGGRPQTVFKGLTAPPEMRSDEPGSVYLIKTERLGSISAGSPVYYRDINVGQVLAYDIGDGFEPITVSIFVRDPFAKYVRAESRFWNASGLSLKIAGGIHIEFQSLQSVLAGGVAFYTPVDAMSSPQAPQRATFSLYDSRKAAEMAKGVQVPCVSYFQSAVKDLAVGSPVQIYGVQVGQVTSVKLQFDYQTHLSRIRVAYNIQPTLAFGDGQSEPPDVAAILNDLVQKGMRVKLGSSDFIAGQETLSLQYIPKSDESAVTHEGDALVLPGSTADFSSITNNLGEVADKLNQIPFEEIGGHLNHLLASADQTLGGADMQQAVHSLAVTLANASDLSRTAKENLTPAMQRLPEISSELQSAATHANSFLASVNSGYGADSDFERSVKRVMNEVDDAARSIRLLADFIDRHPEALIQGKGNGKEVAPKEKP